MRGSSHSGASLDAATERRICQPGMMTVLPRSTPSMAQRAQSALTGALFFLGKETPLRGTVDAQGRCRLEGTIQTLRFEEIYHPWED